MTRYFKQFLIYLLILWISLLVIIPVNPVICNELKSEIAKINSYDACCHSIEDEHISAKISNKENCCEGCNCVKSAPDKAVKHYISNQHNYTELDGLVLAFQQPIAVISFKDKLLSKDLFKPNINVSNTLMALRTVILLN